MRAIALVEVSKCVEESRIENREGTDLKRPLEMLGGGQHVGPRRFPWKLRGLTAEVRLSSCARLDMRRRVSPGYGQVEEGLGGRRGAVGGGQRALSPRRRCPGN
jgi:hypothetical protein